MNIYMSKYIGNQVCEFPVACQLKAKGLKQESMFHWVSEEEPTSPPNMHRYSLSFNQSMFYSVDKSPSEYKKEYGASAYLPSECSNFLPHIILVPVDIEEESTNIHHLTIVLHTHRNWVVSYASGNGDPAYMSRDHNLSNAMGNMIITLIDNNVCSVDALNAIMPSK